MALLNYVAEKKHYITASPAYGLTGDFADNKYNVRAEGSGTWFLIDESEAYITFNFLERTILNEVDWEYEGVYQDSKVEYSLDSFNWYDFPRSQDGHFRNTAGHEVKFVRIRLLDCTNVVISHVRMWGWETIEINNELISLVKSTYYPQRFFEKYKVVPEFIDLYLQMLENPQNSIKSFLPDEIVVTVTIIFDEGDEGSGAIDEWTVNTIPVNGGSATTFSGLSTAIINRVSRGAYYYDVDGNAQVGLRFSATVQGLTGWKEGDPTVKFMWDFDDPFAPSSDPSTQIVTTYGEKVHVFSKLGEYRVKFMVVKDGKTFEGVQLVQISPSPYVITGETYANSGDLYQVQGYTYWPDGTAAAPFIVTEDGTNVGAVLVPDGTNGFTWSLSLSGASGTGTINVYDEFYGELVSYPIILDDVLLDEFGTPILDSFGDPLREA